MVVRARRSREIVYPDSDGQPMGENTLQVKWIVQLYNAFQGLFRHRDDAFVAADLFWYPVRGEPKIVLAPDVMIALGRPKGDRPSYKQWEEAGVPPQIVFEILSPGNKRAERQRKFEFYEQYGVEEYYEYDPDAFVLLAWLRDGDSLVPVNEVDGLTSPRLGISFRVPSTEPMTILDLAGHPFKSHLEIIDDHEAQMRLAEAAIRDRMAEREAKEKLAAKLRELGIDPDRL